MRINVRRIYNRRIINNGATDHFIAHLWFQIHLRSFGIIASRWGQSGLITRLKCYKGRCDVWEKKDDDGEIITFEGQAVR